MRALRLEQYVRLLGERLSEVEEQAVRDKLKDPEYVDIFEEGAWQSARSTSADRAAYIASLVAHGISGDEQARIESKRLLSLLREIDDAEVIILAGHLAKYEHDNDWHNRLGAVLFAMPPTLADPPEAHDAHAIHSAAKDHLIRLALLKLRFRMSRKGEMPELDSDTGMAKAQGAELTWLGLMMLRHIGLANANDF